MSEMMTVYFVTATGHVLGAATRAQAAGAVAAVAAGKTASAEDVLVRGVADDKTRKPPAFASFLVPAPALSTLALAPHPRLPLDPLAFQVPAESHEVQPLGSLTISKVELKVNEVTVSVVAEKTAAGVWVLLLGGRLPAPRIAVAALAAGQDSVTLPLETLAPGDYHLLVLVERRRPFAQSATLSPSSPGGNPE